MSVSRELKIDLTEEFPHLVHAPIVEAVIDIRAPVEVSWDESTISLKLKSKLLDYPKVLSQVEWRHDLEVKGDKLPEATTQDLGWKGLRFQSPDQLHISQFNRDGFVLSRLRPYENWDQLKSETMRLWQFYLELAQPSEINRIGLRFINRIELPPDELRFEDYLEPAPEPPKTLDLPFHSFLHHDTLVVPGHPYAINIIRTIQLPQHPGAEGIAVILDIDAFTLQPFKPRQDVLDQCLAEMRWLKNKVFFGSITQEALEKFQQ